MKRMYLLCLAGLLAMAGCTSDYSATYDEYDEYLQSLGCNAGNPDCVRYASNVAYNCADGACANAAPRYVVADDSTQIKFSAPAGNDLKLETPEYVLQIDGAPNKKYEYRVWAGNKTYNDNPDLIIRDGNASVLVRD